MYPFPLLTLFQHVLPIAEGTQFESMNIYLCIISFILTSHSVKYTDKFKLNNFTCH